MIIKNRKVYGSKPNCRGMGRRIKYNIQQSPMRFTISVISYFVFVFSLGMLIWNNVQFMMAQNALNRLAMMSERESQVSASEGQTIANTVAWNMQIREEQQAINSIPPQTFPAKEESIAEIAQMEASAQVPKPQSTEKVILAQYQELYKQNADMAGWLQIEGTKINYPVMYTQDDFYLNHNFEKKKSASGIPYVDRRFSVDPYYTNTIIHGHNMNNGSMFSSLLRYKDFHYYQEHPVIHFNTIYEKRDYEIIAAFPSKIYPQNDQGSFKPYQFINAKNKQEFTRYIENIKALSLYETNATAEYGDQLLTLMTCAYHTKNGRFIVVARENKNT